MKTILALRLVRLVRTRLYQANQAGAALHWLVGTRVLLGTRYQPYQAGHPPPQTVLVHSGNQAVPTRLAATLVHRGKAAA
jgi:hypothetical protein